jgi:hypothetical protein
VICPSTKLVLPLLEEITSLLAHLDHPVRRVAEHLDDSRHLVVLGRTWEQWQSQEELHHDTAQGPHVDSGGIRKAEQDFGGTVEPGLDISVHGLSLVTSRTEIDNFDDGALEVLEQNVFGFQITVNQAGLVEECKTIKKLLGKDADQSGAESSELVLLDKLVQVDAEELKHQAKMLTVDKSILQAQKMMVVVLVELRVELIAGLVFVNDGLWVLIASIPNRVLKPPSYSG